MVFIPKFLDEQREELKRQEVAARTFSRQVEEFRRAAKRYRDAAVSASDALKLNQKAIADQWSLTSTEKAIAFDTKDAVVHATTPDDAGEQDEPGQEDSTEVEVNDEQSNDGIEQQKQSNKDEMSPAGEQDVTPEQQRPSWMND